MKSSVSYRFSKFANTVERDGVVAVFNSLMLRPLYLDRKLYTTLESHLRDGVREQSDIWQDHHGVFQHFRDNKTIVLGEEEDNHALQRARSNVSTSYPHVLYLLVTDDCNMRCPYCFVRGDNELRSLDGNMLETTAKNVLDFFASVIRNGSSDEFAAEKQIIFYGGEPLLNLPVLRFATKYCGKLIGDGQLPEKTHFQLVTNGTLLTRKSARFLKSAGVNVGISIDGDKVVTDQTRPLKSGKSAYVRILEAIKHCQDLGINVSLSVTVTPLGLARKESLLEQILRLNVKSVGFNMLIGRASSQPGSYNSDVSQFLLDAFNLFRSKGIYEDRMMRKVRSFAEGTLYRFDCAASGGNQIVSTPDGALGICQGFAATREFFYGNANTGIDYSIYQRVCKKWSGRSPVFMDQCLSCQAVAICGGGCPYNAFLNTGSIFGKDERFCIHALTTLHWLLWDLYENTAKDAPTLTAIGGE